MSEDEANGAGKESPDETQGLGLNGDQTFLRESLYGTFDEAG